MPPKAVPLVRLALTLALAGRVAGAAPVVQYRDDRLTVRAEQAPLADVLAEVARVTAAPVRGMPPPREVTVNLDDVPLAEALDRLLGSDNFALRYGADGRLRAIELVGGAARAAPAWPPLEAPTGPLLDPDRQHEVMSRPVEVSARLAAALGTQRPPAGQLIHVALRQRSGKLRAEAQERLLRAFTADPELEATFAATLAPIEDANLAHILRGIGGSHAAQFMGKLAAEAHSPELRAKAAAVLEALREADRAADG